MSRPAESETMQLAWRGTIRDHEAEQRFIQRDTKDTFNLRAAIGSAVLLMMLFCFVQDFCDRVEHQLLAIYTFMPPILLTAAMLGTLAWIARTQAASGRCAGQVSSTCIRYGDALWGLTILINAAAYQIRIIRLCQSSSADTAIPCMAYRIGAFPVRPALHALCCAASFAILSQNYIASIITTAAIMGLFQVQTNVLYHPPQETVGSRLDLALVSFLQVMAFGCLAIIGSQWPLYRRKQFLAVRALEERLEEYRRVADQLREAGVREKKLLADTVRAQALQAQIEDRANLLRYLFHEIRVPLNTVSMGIELLQEDATGLDPESTAHLGMMSAACGTAISTLSDALDLSKLERSQNEPPPLKPTRVIGLLEDAVSHNTPFASGNSVQLSCDYQQDGLPEWVLGDPQGLKQVLNNFVTNAIKFSPKDGTGQIKVWAGLALPPEALVDSLASPRSAATSTQSGGAGSSTGTEGKRNSQWADTTPQVEVPRSPTLHPALLSQLNPTMVTSLAAKAFKLATNSGDDGQRVPASCAHATITMAEGWDTVSETSGSQSMPPSTDIKVVQLYLAVCDNGVGISQEELPKLYGAFQQLEAGIEYKGRGTGLGLAISKGIIGRLQGTVGVRSAEGHGSVFYVTLTLPVLLSTGPHPVEHSSGVSRTTSSRSLGQNSFRGRRHSTPNQSIMAEPDVMRVGVSPQSKASDQRGQAPLPAYAAGHGNAKTQYSPTGDAVMRVGKLPLSIVASVLTSGDTGRQAGYPDREPERVSSAATRVDTTRVDTTRTSGAAFDDGATDAGAGHMAIVVQPATAVPGSVIENNINESEGGPDAAVALTRVQVSATGRRASALAHADGHVSGGRRHHGHTDGALHPRTVFLGSALGSTQPTADRPDRPHTDGMGQPVLSASNSASTMATDICSPTDGTTVTSEHSTTPVRVLVVEDVLSNRMMLVKLVNRRWKGSGLSLQHGPLECTEAENGEIALQTVATSPAGHFSAVLMDGNMPVLDGYDATTRLRQAGYTGLILGLTGNGLPADVERFRAVGADDVLIKPADAQDVANRIGAALGAPALA